MGKKPGYILTGARTWAFRYRFNGKPRKLTIGPYPAIGLAKARAETIKAKSALASAHDPASDKQAARADRRQTNIVEKVIGDFISMYWSAAGDLGFPFGPIVRLLILTGQRRSEVGAMEWGEIDIETWTIPAARSKNRRQHSVPLSSQAIEILKGLPRFSGSKYVFGAKAPASGYSSAKERLDGIITKLNDGEPVPDWVLHDARRSFASGLAGIGISLHVIERCLNHVSGSFSGIVGVYQKHSFSAEMREAMGRFTASASVCNPRPLLARGGSSYGSPSRRDSHAGT